MTKRSFGGQGTGAHNRAKTHCPRGHPYSGDNLYVNKLGRRNCRACAALRYKMKVEAGRQWTWHTGTYVPEWRDQACPICDAKWFVNASTHVRKVHGLRIPGLVSESLRLNREIIMAELNNFDMSQKAIAQRHRRWVRAILDEQAAGGAYIIRLAKRWRIPHGAANSRVQAMTREGLVARKRKPSDPRRSPRDDKGVCKRGHLKSPENGHVNQKGCWICRICNRDLHRLRQLKLGHVVRPRYRDS